MSAQLLSDVASVRPDQPFEIGVLFDIDPGWHIYWKNPGDSGSPTRVTLHLPAGFTADPVQYPVPDELRLAGDVVNYAYQKQVMLTVRVHPALQLMDAGPTQISISADVRYLVCNDVCLPGSAKLAITLPVSSSASAAPSPSADLFTQWGQRMPLTADPADVSGVTCDVQLGATGNKAHATIRLQWNDSVPADIAFFPGPVKGFDISDVKNTTTGITTTCSFELNSPSNALLPPMLDTVVAFTPENHARVGLSVPVPSINRQTMPPPVPPAAP